MQIGIVIFPDVTQLDFTGPYEVFTRLPGATVTVLAHSLEPVTAKGGLRFLPDQTLDRAPQCDLLCVPGGPGVGPLMTDRPTLEFLRRQAQHARYLASVCTGALVLGAAGLLQSYRATTHWLSLDLLPFFGATIARERVVIDRNRITGGGVTAGIDLALTVVKEVAGAAVAQAIQLGLEYLPAPPFACGHPDTADPALVAEVRRTQAAAQAVRREQAQRAAALYC